MRNQRDAAAHFTIEDAQRRFAVLDPQGVSKRWISALTDPLKQTPTVNRVSALMLAMVAWLALFITRNGRIGYR